MADDTTSLNVNDLPKTPHAKLSFLNSEDVAKQETGRDAAPAAPRPETAPGRRPLFRI